MNSRICFALLSWPTPLFDTNAPGTAFTCRGRLSDSANSANGCYNPQFILFNVRRDRSAGKSKLVHANVAVNSVVAQKLQKAFPEDVKRSGEKLSN